MKNKPPIIPRTASRWQTIDWQNSLKKIQIPIHDLLAVCEVEADNPELQAQAAQHFNLKVPPHYLSLIRKGDANDPLLRQILPSSLEVSPDNDTATLNFVEDPLNEAAFNPMPGLIHKYHGRVLLIANPSCAIHCRYCFRRHFDYQDNAPNALQWQNVVDYIAKDDSIHEVILSGGDPLSNNDTVLNKLINKIEAVEHVSTLRLHTRIPSVMPERITDDLLNILHETRLKVIIVLHINHAQEISDEVVEAVSLLQSYGVRLLNQTVLLANINDSATILRLLYIKLHTLDIQAYYLHVLDKVKGAEHFLNSDEQAIAIYRELQASLPAYMLPKLVREEAEHKNKTLLA